MLYLFVLVLSVLFVSPAWADDAGRVVGHVEAVSIQDARGKWVRVAVSPDAVRIRADEEVPLEKGLELVEGDRIRTGLARAVVSLETKEHLNVSEHALLTLKERTVLQYLGDVYYQLRGAFSVQYGPVETTVEGTRFLVHGPDPVQVGVVEGRVRVKNETESVRIERGQQVTAAVSDVSEPLAWSGREQRHAVRGIQLLEPDFELGISLSPGILALEPGFGGLAAGMRLRGRAEVLPYLGVGGFAGLSSNPPIGGIRAPFGVGPEVRIRSVTFGAHWIAEYEYSEFTRADDLTGLRVAWHFGPEVVGRYQKTITGPLALELDANAGWVQGLRLGIGVGLGVKL